jgi:hypothetical protein
LADLSHLVQVAHGVVGDLKEAVDYDLMDCCLFLVDIAPKIRYRRHRWRAAYGKETMKRVVDQYDV